MPKYRTHISDGESGKTLSKFIIVTYQVPNSSKWKADTKADNEWPESTVTQSMIGGFDTEAEALDFAMSEIERINEISNRHNDRDVNDIYHEPTLIEEPH